MNDKFSVLLGAAIVPQVIDLIIKNDCINELDAVKAFYSSDTYALLGTEETKVWHYSPLTIYHIWKAECETGQVILPEEGALA